MGVELKGWERLKKALTRFAEKFDREINDAIGGYIVSKTQYRIDNNLITPPTGKFTRSLKEGKKLTLKDSGMLYGSLTYQLEGNRIIKIGSRGVPYAKVHQFGATIKPKKAQRE